MQLLTLLLCMTGVLGMEKDFTISNFLSERASWQPMCLYTFDNFINNENTIKNRVPDESCPFDALQPDTELVTSLNRASSYWQLGVHLAEAPNNDTKRLQLSSISSVSAREFFSTAAVTNSSLNSGGVTIELVVRIQPKTNHSMTLFSISNEYDDCADSGFRLDVNEHQVLAFIYFLPVLEEDGKEVEACYERRLFSVNNVAKCQLPVDKSQAVHITVTLDPSEQGLWKTSFYVSYTDPDTMQRMDCVVHDEQHPPSTQVLNNLIKGCYRLYLGNSPRNVTSPRQRRHLAPARQFTPFGNTSMNATERLRVMLKQKLENIRGPELPKAMRIFGDNSLSLSILGITFPPLNEDTPLAYLRSKFADFKEKYGDQVVDYLVNLVQQKAKGPIVTNREHNSSDESDKFSRANLFQSAGGSSFDLFHFAIYRHVVSEEEVASISRKVLLPSRQFPSLQQTARIPEDSFVLLNLTLLDGVFNDLRLELRDLPEFGRLLLFPSKIPVTMDNLDAFRELPLKDQRSIFFQPEPDQNNENLPLPNPVAFSRRLEPYATVSFGIAESLVGREVNKSMAARIDIFVDAVNDAPRPQQIEEEVFVEIGVPVTLDLKGEDIDGAPEAVGPQTGASGSSDLLSRFDFTNEMTNTSSFQLLKIVKMPKFGKLFDCNTSSDSESPENGRIYHNNTELVNATHSTTLRYIYHGREGANCTLPESSLEVDELRYQLSDGDPLVFSSVAVIKFFLLCGKEKPPENQNMLSTVRVQEDSLQLVTLSSLDPLAALFHSKTRLKVSVLPQHGSLFQYHGSENSTINVSLTFVGARISTPNTTIESASGQIFYALKQDYFNTMAHQRVSRVDFFEYQVLNTLPTNSSVIFNEKSPAARFINGLEPRRVQLEVENVKDSVVILPPFVFKTNVSSGGTVPTPVVFQDPDSIHSDDLYQVNLEAEDGTFELGFAISDDDVMSGCPYERPCMLNRSTNGNSTSSRDEELQFYIATQLFDPSHIQVTGTKLALNSTLSALSFRSLAGNTQTAEFTVWVGRIHENGSEQQIETSFTIKFQPESPNEVIATVDFVSVLKTRYIPTFLVLLAGWLVLSNGNCLSVGFCCCCCGKARKKRRRKLEQQQKLFQEQVAQNDYEYSVLLMDLADILLEPELVVARCVLESCFSSTYNHVLLQTFVWRSLLPLLESERQGTRFVFQLLATEYSQGKSATDDAVSSQHEDFLTQNSTASKVLASFCRAVGASWVSELLTVDILPVELDNLLTRITAQVEELPVEVVILCRACARLFHDENDLSPETELDAVHLVFFNHFLGPALEFPLENVRGFNPSKQQRDTLRALAYQIASFRTGRTAETDTSRCKYEAVLERILHASNMKSAYDPEEATEVDCELMGMCLMNIHSLLECYFLEFKDRICLVQAPVNAEQVKTTVLRLSRLLKALDWPLTSIHELIDHAKPELLDDPLLWNGFSFQEWQERAQTEQSASNITTEKSLSLPTHEFDEIILEGDDRSPLEVDWVN
ncbi:hypothetical protein P3T76_010096 [Phytophthora citrophthora]|uniref:Ras-GAP domain-containing protein n=1 Tax=Phytophthora citrophthora TaxID=4793 RepID=A0AAD9GEE1_9STRA|nr:hypothetical protein P3T76_010096 [Phytophthora citrophthora]